MSEVMNSHIRHLQERLMNSHIRHLQERLQTARSRIAELEAVVRETQKENDRLVVELARLISPPPSEQPSPAAPDAT